MRGSTADMAQAISQIPSHDRFLLRQVVRDHNYIGHNYIDNDYIGHNYIDNDYIGHNYTGHNSIGHDRFVLGQVARGPQLQSIKSSLLRLLQWLL